MEVLGETLIETTRPSQAPQQPFVCDFSTGGPGYEHRMASHH